MNFVIALLTVVLVLNCLFLILLVLIQLPKKDAGAGIAFGGGATDALFGAGSGNALTKITKYCAGVFLGLSLLLSVMRAHRSEASGGKFEEELRKKAASSVAPGPLPTNLMVSAPTNAPGAASTGTGPGAPVLESHVPTNSAASNAPAGPPK